MIKFYAQSAFRNLVKNKFYSVINIVGLTIGIMACVFIMLYVQSELSYDKFHENSHRIYRVNLLSTGNNDNNNWAKSSAPLKNAMLDEIPEVEEAVRVTTYWKPVMQYNDKVFNETKWCFADDNFFNVFTSSFIQGGPSEALVKPYTVVLTESTAKRYFGDENPLGKTLTRKYNYDWTVTGVIKDFPENSHLKPDFIASIKSRPYNTSSNWINNMLYTYVLLKEGASSQAFDTKLEAIVSNHVGQYLMQHKGTSLEEFTAKGNKYKYYTQSLHKIHFDKEVVGDLELPVNSIYMVLFSIIAVSILIIACINYMNMSTARSVNRAKEVGLKKSLGSNRKHLVLQFLSESIFVTLIALVLALILIKVLLPTISNLIDKRLVFSYTDNLSTIPLLLVFGVVIGIVAGSYPAFIMSSFSPLKVLKGINKSEGSHSYLRSGLVVFQLIVTIILFSGTFLINKQLNFLQSKELGFNKENLIIVKNAHYLWNQKSALISELREQSGILEVSNSIQVPGRSSSANLFFNELANDAKWMNQLWVDNNFLKTYEIELVQGRFFEEGNPTNSKSIVLIESALKDLNIDDPIGKKLYKGKKTDETALTIIGVIKDFHLHSLHQEMSPLVLINNDRALKSSGQFLSVRISGNIQENLKNIEKTWNKYAGGQPFVYSFFDEDFGRLYAFEKRTKKITTVFAVLGILITCLGLLALATFVAEQRTKEIGIRKVNGAKISEILAMLNRDFIKWVAIAFVLACPIAYYAMNKWLENFAYKTELSWWIFALAGVLALGIALLTVSWQSWRAATRNPVDALRYE
ncbi:FtsX-like permease family protein [Puteibacter caeruleilacunae]|nr:FtsX-like permease family protein [Puteibacter caeruleilacunae]